MHSALKRNGQPLYKLARKGIKVEREPRKVSVFELSLINFDGNLLELEIHCTKGFYVRSLAMDLGKVLGCGGHVENLKRLSVGQFELDNCINIDQLEVLNSASVRHNMLLPVDEALRHLPKINLPEHIAHHFCRGQVIHAIRCPTRGLARLYSENNQFLGLGEVIDQGKITPRRIFV